MPRQIARMIPVNDLTPKALKKAADIKEKILKLQHELDQLLDAPAPNKAALRLRGNGG